MPDAPPDAWLGSLNALSDPTRLRLLRLLEHHELGVADLCDALRLPQSTVSRHLKLLADEGWIGTRRQGTAHLSRVVADRLSPARRRLWQLAREQLGAWTVLRDDEQRLRRRLEARGAASRRFFAGAAGEWDRLRAQLFGPSLTLQAVAALLDPSAAVADLGCGAGHLLAAIAPQVREVVGVDNTAAMLDAARHRCADLGNVRLLEGELHDLPLEDGAADVAVMALALSYVAEPPAALREMRRIVRAGGRAVVIDVAAHDRDDLREQLGQTRLGFEAEELRDLLADAGFASPAVRALEPDPAAKGPRLFAATARVAASH